LAEKMIRLAGYVPYQDIQIKEIGLRPGEKLYEELHLNKEEVVSTPNNLIFVTKPMSIPKEKVLRELDELAQVIAKPQVDDQEIIDVLIHVVENYTPNRSSMKQNRSEVEEID